MNIVDILIIIFLLFGFLLGWKHGFTKQIVSTVGFIVVIVLSFVLKNYVSSIFYTYLPFFKFGGAFKGVTALNILLYELLAFIIVFCLLMAVFKVLVKTSSTFEKILNATIILGIPSKILGGIAGIIEHYIICFFVIYFLSLPVFYFIPIDSSSIGSRMLNSTPVLSNVCKNTLEIYHEVIVLKNEYKDSDDKSKFNDEVIKLLVERDVISEENVDKLVSQGKIKAIEN